MGTIASYLGIQEGEKTQIYRCPSHPVGVVGSGEGSNGMFDYAMIGSLGGARLSQIPSTVVVLRDRENEQRLLTPLIVEEDPIMMNGAHIEPGHAAGDRIGSWHRGGVGFYAAIDGSVGQITSHNGIGPRAVDWEVNVGEEWYIFAPFIRPWGEVPW